MSNKIKEVARAIYEDRNGHGCKAWSRLPKAHQEPYLADARAAIKAMLVPTQAMIEAASADEGVKNLDGAVQFAAIHGHRLNHVDGKPPVIRAYNAMISAALREEGET